MHSYIAALNEWIDADDFDAFAYLFPVLEVF